MFLIVLVSVQIPAILKDDESVAAVVIHAGANDTRQDVLDRLGLLLFRRELLGEALDGGAEQPSLGDGGVEKACLVDVLHLCQVEPEMALLDHHGGHRLPEGPRRDFCRS